MTLPKARLPLPSSPYDTRAAARHGTVIDAVPPGALTQGRWTVRPDALLIGPVLCTSSELRSLPQQGAT